MSVHKGRAGMMSGDHGKLLLFVFGEGLRSKGREACWPIFFFFFKSHEVKWLCRGSEQCGE